MANAKKNSEEVFIKPVSGMFYDEENTYLKVIEYYQAGHTTYETADHFHCSQNTVYFILRDNSIPIHARKNKTRKVILENLPKIRKYLKKGFTRTEISRLLNLSPANFIRELAYLQIYPIQHTNTFYYEHKAEIIKLKIEGFSYPDIIRRIGGNVTKLIEFCKEERIEPKPKKYFSKSHKHLEQILCMKKQGLRNNEISRELGLGKNMIRLLLTNRVGGVK